MRFSLGKRGEDDDANRRAVGNGFNSNGSRSRPGPPPQIAPTPAPPVEKSLFDEPAPLGDDPPALIGDRRGDPVAPAAPAPAALAPNGVSTHGASTNGHANGASTNGASTNGHGDGAATNGHANGAATNGHADGASANGQASAGMASQTVESDPHMPLGEGPTPQRDEHPTAQAGIAVPGTGSDAAVPSSAEIFSDESSSGEHAAAEPVTATSSADTASAPSSRVSVVDEQPPRPAPPAGASEEEYKWHTYRVYPSGRPDAVEFIDTYRSFGKNRILRGLNMGLPEGMVSMILGPSGTGKSVCIKHMVGLLYPDQGDVLVHGRSVPNMVDDELFEMRKKFGLLFQDGALFGSMNLYDNVAFPLRQHTEKGEDEIEDIVMRRLNEVGLGSARDKYPNELSGGMRKRAGFARALVLGPDIVLFDEPDSGLDPVRTSLLGELILEVHRDMMDEAKAQEKPSMPTFCVITHNVMMARRTADYINVLWKGRIVEAGPTEDMLNSPNPFIRQFLAGESMGPLTMD
jgi:phospholipid/cholesterol/gamma-HCH transport system ATP-binding protein